MSRLLGSAVAVAVVLASVVVVGGAPAGAVPSSAPPKAAHGTGLLLPTDEVAPMKRFRTSAAAPALPASVDLTPWAVPAGDQGQVNSCTAWSVGYTLTGWWASRAGKPTAFAPMYVYSQTHLSSSVDGGGAYLSSAFGIGSDQGIDTRAHYSHSGTDFSSSPNAAETANAAGYRIGALQRLYSGRQGVAASGGRTAIETALAAGRPVVIGIPIFDSFSSLDATNHRYSTANVAGSQTGYHAVVVLGYDADGVTIENSWGDGWGDHGFAQLAWDFVLQYSTEADTTTGLVSTPPDTGIPSWPVRVATAVDANTATVTWDAPAANGAQITGYRVTRDGQDLARTGARSVDVSATTRSVGFSNLYPSTRYTLTVQALTASGGGETATVGARTAAAAVPPVPIGLQATPGRDGRTVALAWTAPSSTGGWPILQYQAVVTGGGAISVRALPTTSPAGVAGLEPGTEYTVAFSAVNQVGAGPVASATFRTPDLPVSTAAATGPAVALSGAPGPVRDLALSAGADGSATLSWTAPQQPAGELRTVHVRWSELADLRGSVLASGDLTLPIATTSIPVGKHPAARAMRFDVWTVDADGNRSATTELETATAASTVVSSSPPAPTVPARPVSVSARPSGASVVVRWAAGSGADSATGWRVTVGSAVAVLTDASARAVVVRDVPIAAALRVSVVGENSSGAGRAAVTSVTVPRVLSAPKALRATPAAGRLVLHWGAPVGTGGRVVGYRITRSGLDVHGHRFAPRTVAAGDRSFVLVGLRRHRPYTVTVRAVAASARGPVASTRATTR